MSKLLVGLNIEQRDKKKKSTKRVIIKFMPAMKALFVRCAAEQSCRQAPAAITVIIAPILHIDIDPGDRESDCGGIMEHVAV